MPRNKREIVEASNAGSEQTHLPPASEQPAAAAGTTAEGAMDATSQNSDRSGRIARSYKATLTLSDKGVTLGKRNGHDWVVTFPGDPGKEVKDKLMGVGFAYHNRQWRVFTNAANRPPVETLIKEMKRQLGEEIDVHEYTTNQVVLAFDAVPSQEIVDQLKERGFYYRADRTWNADATPDNRKAAQELIQSLPAVSRSAGR